MTCVDCSVSRQVDVLLRIRTIAQQASGCVFSSTQHTAYGSEHEIPRPTDAADSHLSLVLVPATIKHQQCSEKSGNPPPPTAPALGNHISRISETGEEGSEFSTMDPAALAPSSRSLAPALQIAEGGGDQEETESQEGFGEHAGYGVAYSGKGLGSGDGSASDGGGGGGEGEGDGGDSDPSGDAAAAFSTPTRRNLNPSACSTPSRRFMVHQHHGVGSYEVFMDYVPSNP